MWPGIALYGLHRARASEGGACAGALGTGCARRHLEGVPQRHAGARHERTLAAGGCSAWGGPHQSLTPWGNHIPPNYVVAYLSPSSKASGREDLQVEHPV